MSDLVTVLSSLSILVFLTIVYAIVKGWYDNKRWEKKIYKILERYRNKYGDDAECGMIWEDW